MKALFIGLGSIGQRHLQNLLTITDSAIDIIAYRTTNINKIIINGEMSECDSISNHYGFSEYNNFDDIIEQKPSMSFICNPSNLHLEYSQKLASIKSNLFIEKPVATSLKKFSRLEKTVEKNNLITLVAYQSRFHPILQEIKNLIECKTYGKIISADFKWHNFLPHFHRYEDYSLSYAARKELGGGVIFGLSHEIDLIQWFFGMPLNVYAIEGAKTKLNVNVEDTVSIIFKCSDKQRIFPVSLSLSYAQRYETRNFSILMEDALITVDLEKKYMLISDHKKKYVIKNDFKNVKRNDLFLKEIKHFFSSCINGQSSEIPLSEGKKSLIISLAIKESLSNNKIVEI